MLPGVDVTEFSKMATTVYFLLCQKYHLLLRGHNVPIPAYYHATKYRYITSIIETGSVVRSQAICGYGAYVSTQDESYIYGNDYLENASGCTLAFDAETIENISGYVLHRDETTRNRRIWIRLHSDIPVTSNTVSFIAINPDKRGSHKLPPKFKDGVGTLYIDRRILDLLCDVLNSANSQFVKPRIWL